MPSTGWNDLFMRFLAVYSARLRLHPRPWHVGRTRWAPRMHSLRTRRHPRRALRAHAPGLPRVTVPGSPPLPPARPAAASSGARGAPALRGARSLGGGGLGQGGKPREAVPGAATGSDRGRHGRRGGAGARRAGGVPGGARGAHLPGGAGSLLHRARAAAADTAGTRTARTSQPDSAPCKGWARGPGSGCGGGTGGKAGGRGAEPAWAGKWAGLRA